MRYTRASVPEDERYLASTAVVMSEVLKTLVCLVVLYYIPLPHRRSLARLYALLNRELVIKWRETAKLAFPAILYLIQVFKSMTSLCVWGSEGLKGDMKEQLAIRRSHEPRCSHVPSDLPTQNPDDRILYRDDIASTSDASKMDCAGALDNRHCTGGITKGRVTRKLVVELFVIERRRSRHSISRAIASATTT